MEIDEELRECAALALRNAFYTEFSKLCNTYIEASECLGVANQEEMLGDLTSIYGRAETLIGPYPRVETTSRGMGLADSSKAKNMLTALNKGSAYKVYLNERCVFKRNKEGEWMYVDT